MLHSAIHLSRPDIKAIIHLHHPACVAVSAMKQGLLICCQEAAILGPVSYHDYRGLVVDEAERELIARDLGPNNKVCTAHFPLFTLGDGCTNQSQHTPTFTLSAHSCPRHIVKYWLYLHIFPNIQMFIRVTLKQFAVFKMQRWTI